MSKRLTGALAAAALLLVPSVPLAAQGYSDSYNFLKAVRDRDGTKVTQLTATPNAVLVNARERTTGDGALHIVTRGRDASWLSFLIGKGAKVDLQNGEGMTPLALAAQVGWTEGVERLLGRGASVDLANSRGETPLILAVQNRDIVTVRLLLARGADPKRADRVAGYSALDYAKRDNRAAAILKLLETAKPAKPVSGPKL